MLPSAEEGQIMGMPASQPVTTIDELLAIAAEGADVVVPLLERQPQYLHSVWRTAAHAALEAAFARGVRSIKGALDGLDVVEAVVTRSATLHDADRPDDLPPQAPSVS